MATEPKRQRLDADEEGNNANGQRQLELRSGDIKYFFEINKKERGYVKHAILKRFLQAWFPKLCSGGWYTKVVYVDGFSGTGKHVQENEDGSPLVAYLAAITHSCFLKWTTKIKMIFIEKDEENAEKLRENLRFASNGQDSRRISWRVITGEFCQEMPNVLNKYQDLPMLVFADPYGYSQTPMKLMQTIMCRRGPIDIIVSVMDSFALRFGLGVGDDKENAMTKFLGVGPEIWKQELSTKLSPEERRRNLMQIYTKQLSGRQDLLTLQFGMRREKNNTHVYHFFFATRHEKGMESMKEAMWRQSQRADQLVFSEFDKANGKMVDFKEKQNERTAIVVPIVKQAFNGQIVTGEIISDYILSQTIYRVEKTALRKGLQEYVRHPEFRIPKFENIIFDFSKDVFTIENFHQGVPLNHRIPILH